MLYPLTFHPLFKERIWGGRDLEKLFQKPLPPGQRIGESWEISDRPAREGRGDVSVIANGPLAGEDLRWLMENHRDELLGKARAAEGRFPLLVKILDAQDKLSLQVHPPPDKARELGGEPKTEIWFIASATPEAELFVGLRRGVTRAEFEARLQRGGIQDCFHRIAVRAGDTMFLPSGRVHAIGAGNVIFEIQQNSDTTYRVYDWDRVEPKTGKPRQLHLPESLASIDFADIEPAIIRSPPGSIPPGERVLVDDPLFKVVEKRLAPGRSLHTSASKPMVVGMISGSMTIRGAGQEVPLRAGGFCLVPACLGNFEIACDNPATWLGAVPG